MKIKTLLAVSTVFVSSFAIAQQTYVNKNGSMDYMYSKKAPSQPAQGTQYYIEKFTPAKIDDSKEVALVRYNAYNDEMELKINDEIMVLEPKDDMDIKLVNNAAEYKFVKYKKEEGDAAQGYLVVISNNPNVTIYKQERIYLQPEQHPSVGYQKYKAPKYKELSPIYYIQLNNGPIVYMSDRRKDVYKLIPGKEKEIKRFIKDNRINVSDDEELKELGNYLSTLL
ncbi:hypothetical protein GCM10007424_07620 [Flavobacterium suaedae]|uniref:GLPGLI family protein n=1 Tax=Flavobacterium suaedae TaxID=1767027 RepID=A0ABQ1JIW4_9FLAO|nr:hypothetical protein [Flavobacterium suaedae]GGB70135.1 hypothetical protein GCM10007424_07620 [Flavobacterium suaedae]